MTILTPSLILFNALQRRVIKSSHPQYVIHNRALELTEGNLWSCRSWQFRDPIKIITRDIDSEEQLGSIHPFFC
jgi:hypothetical protein